MLTSLSLRNIPAASVYTIIVLHIQYCCADVPRVITYMYTSCMSCSVAETTVDVAKEVSRVTERVHAVPPNKKVSLYRIVYESR